MRRCQRQFGGHFLQSRPQLQHAGFGQANQRPGNGDRATAGSPAALDGAISLSYPAQTFRKRSC